MFRAGVCIFVLAAAAGCTTGNRPSVYLHRSYDFSVIKRAAVLPFENLTSDQTAGEKVRKVVVSELLASGVIDVIEPGQVNRVLAQQGIQNPSALLPADIKKLGAALDVQALILGSVETFERVSLAAVSSAEVGITLRAVDVASGTIVWSVSERAGGVGLAGRLFGLGGVGLSEAAGLAARQAVRTLFQ
jgi:TolB-like protein